MYIKFNQNPTIHSQVIKQKLNFDVKQGPELMRINAISPFTIPHQPPLYQCICKVSGTFIEKNPKICEDDQEIPQSQSTAFLRHQVRRADEE